MSRDTPAVAEVHTCEGCIRGELEGFEAASYETDLRVCVCVCMCVCVCVCVRVQPITPLRMHTQVYTKVFVYTYTRVYTHTRVCTHTHSCTHAHTHTTPYSLIHVHIFARFLQEGLPVEVCGVQQGFTIVSLGVEGCNFGGLGL